MTTKQPYPPQEGLRWKKLSDGHWEVHYDGGDATVLEVYLGWGKKEKKGPLFSIYIDEERDGETYRILEGLAPTARKAKRIAAHLIALHLSIRDGRV